PLCGPISACRQLRGQNTERRQTCRFAGGAAHEIRVRYQPKHRQDARSYHSSGCARHRRRGDRMSSRREFITLLGGAAAWPLAARAQQAERVPTIGFLGPTTRSAENQWIAAFVQRLRELGWIEGRTVAIEYRWADGRSERAAEIATEFVRRKVDVIVASGTPVVVAAMQAT